MEINSKIKDTLYYSDLMMEINSKIKDTLYYSDLMYDIRDIAGFEQERNELVERRNKKRYESIVENQELELDSLVFREELFQIISNIQKKAGVPFKSFYDISRYPELVNEELEKLEIKKKSVDTQNKIVNEELEKLTEFITKCEDTENKNVTVEDGAKLVKKTSSPIPTLSGAQLTKIFQVEIRMILNCENHNNESNSKFVRKTILCEFTPDEFIDLNTKDSFVRGSGLCTDGVMFIVPETIVPIIDLIDKAKDNMSSPPEDVIQFAGHDLTITGDEYAIWYINYAIQQIKNNHQLMTDVINLSSASNEIYRFSTNGMAIQGERHTLIAIYKRLYCDYFNRKIIPTTMIGILFQIRRALIPNDYNYDRVFAEQHRISQENEPDKNANIQEQSGPVLTKKKTPLKNTGDK